MKKINIKDAIGMELGHDVTDMCKTQGAHFTAVSEGKKVMVSDINGMFRVDKELLN